MTVIDLKPNESVIIASISKLKPNYIEGSQFCDVDLYIESCFVGLGTICISLKDIAYAIFHEERNLTHANN